jgi:exodeoxyribonuclease VII large subunit
VNRQVVSVQLLTSYIRELVESDDFLSDLWVEGEIAEAFPARSGHIYFTLRDDDSRIKCVLFRAQAQYLRSLPRSGEQVAVHGRLSVYERDGNYQLYVDFIQPAGQGILALQLELLRQQLTLEGLFEPSRKRPIPRMPMTIGVVTSGDGAVWHDIQQVLRRRFPLVHLILAPTAVQGDHAPEQIVAALQALQTDGRAEVIIVARGGGSAQDLLCFNDERVVRAVFACRVPVVSGVGHETDWTLIDDVADLRAPTPSAAAELCSPSIVDLAERLVDAQRLADRVMSDRLGDLRRRLDRPQSTLTFHSPTRVFQLKRAEIGVLRERMIRNREQRLANERATITGHSVQLDILFRDQITARQNRLNLEQARLQALDPRSVLRRGFAFVTSGTTGLPVHHVGDVSRGSQLTIQLTDGVIAGTVDGVAPGSIAYAGSRNGVV